MNTKLQELFDAMMQVREDYDPENPPQYASKRKKPSEYLPVTDPNIHAWRIEEPRARGELLMAMENPENAIIMYIHGGGFTMERAESRREICSWFTLHGYNVISVNYRLAPDHRFPEGLEDCLDVYEYLLEAYAPERIAVMGDGAGANLAVAMVLLAKEQGLPTPAVIAAISPISNMERRNRSWVENQETDCVLSPSRFRELQEVYLPQKEQERNPFASIVYGTYEQFPPMIITCSDTECLRDDAEELYETVRRSGVECSLRTYSGMIHAFQIHTELQESEEALSDILQFIKARMGK